MLQQRGDIWESRLSGDWVVVTTNGTLRNDGALVMGRGIAKEAAQKHPGLARTAGNLIRTNGLKVEPVFPYQLLLFPVKYEFYQRADINLILKSTLQMLAIFNSHGWQDGRVLMGRPGCGNGKLDWAEVSPLLHTYLTDDRYVVFSK